MLEIPVVKVVIVGSRLSAESEKYISSNLSAYSFQLDEDDRDFIPTAQEKFLDIPGDSGDEDHRPHFLTTSGDLSHHIHA